MADTVRITGLTTCEVVEGGAQIRLLALNDAGQQVTLELPAALAGCLVLTLPRLMERCLQQLRGDATRLVFPMERWQLEGAAEADAFILTLETPDGFKVAFAVSMDDAREVADALQTYCAASVRPHDAAMLN